MKLEKKMTDDILLLTESKPLDLLKWFQMIYRNCPDEKYPCNLHPYLGKYSFYNDVIFCEGAITITDSNNISIFDIWRYVCKSPKNFKDIIRQFKKLYKGELR